jgi:hypothetical protein
MVVQCYRLVVLKFCKLPTLVAIITDAEGGEFIVYRGINTVFSGRVCSV